MLIRNTQGHVEAAAKNDFDIKQYTWHIYTSLRGTKFKSAKGEVSLRKGDFFGVKEFTSKDDKVLMLNAPTLVFKLAISKSEKLMDEKGKECRGGKLPKAAGKPAAPPKKVKINLDDKPAKADDFTYVPTPVVCDHCGKKAKHGLIIKKKTYAEQCAADKLGVTLATLRKMYKTADTPKAATPKAATPKATAPKAAKVKLTANQKAIAALKDEIKRIKALKANPANLRKIAKLKDDLKKKQAKEKAAAPAATKPAKPVQPDAAPKAPKTPKPAKPVQPDSAPKAPKHPAEEKAAKPKAADVKLPEEFETARALLKAIDKGGVPLNPAKLNAVGRELGLDISRSAKPQDTVDRIRAAVQRAIETAQAQQAENAKTVKKVKITVTPGDDDDEDIPHGSVRYGGKLIEPDELEFDDDTSGLVDLPVDQSWSSEIEGEETVIDAQFQSKRMQ